MTAWYDANGMRIVQNVYDDQGRVTTQTDANGGVSSLAYKDGQTVATDANGNQTVYYYDDQMRTVKVKIRTAQPVLWNTMRKTSWKVKLTNWDTRPDISMTRQEMKPAALRFDGKKRPGTMTRTIMSFVRADMTELLQNIPMINQVIF